MSKILSSVSYDLRFSITNKIFFNLNSLRGYRKFEYIQKRVIDYIMVIILFSFLWPVALYAIYRIKKESTGPILFKQTRVGLNGKKFVCYKFRSMHIDSKFNPYTEDNDSRIFPFGEIMRKMRIDELAQLINIVKGDMHLVGPRAEWDILVDKYKKVIPNYNTRHNVRPGITGLAQVKYPYGRDVYDAEQKLIYDLEYIKNWSIWLECKVLCQTVMVILRKSGV
jgi:lipopolysaccharide/colanic/teichoic acid biosynthesis glycosyltransferase